MDSKKAAGAGPHVAVVTGASSGIGEAVARLLSRRGYELVVTARREDRLGKLKAELEASGGKKVHVVALDLADPASPRKLWDETQALGLAVDTLVNNAGAALPGQFLETKWRDQARLMQLLAATPAELIHLYAPAMVKSGYGRVLNVSSIGAFCPASPNVTLYAALKHFVLVMNQSLQEETRGTGVRFTALCPGATETELVENSHQRPIFDKFPQWAILSAADVAQKACAAMVAGEDVVVTGAATRVARRALNLLPDSLAIRWLRESYAGVRP